MAERETPTGKHLKFFKFVRKVAGPHSSDVAISSGHAVEGVRTNGLARKSGISDALDYIDEDINHIHHEVESAVEHLRSLINAKQEVTNYMDKNGIVRCPDCLVGSSQVTGLGTRKGWDGWEDRDMYLDNENRNSLGESMGPNDWNDCFTCDGHGVVFRPKR